MFANIQSGLLVGDLNYVPCALTGTHRSVPGPAEGDGTARGT